MHKRILAIFLILIVTIPCICAYSTDINELQEQSNEITKNLTETNNRLQAVQEQVSENMAELQQLNTELAQYEDETNKIKDDLDQLNQEISENEQKLEKIQTEYDNIQGLIDSRLVEMYKSTDLQFLDVLLTSTSINDFLTTYYALVELNKYDTELLENAKQQKIEIETTKQILEEKRKQAITDKQTYQKKSQVLQNMKKKQEFYLSKLTAEEKELQAQIDEYNAQVAEIEAEIKFLASESISESYIGGAFIWPVPGHTSLTSLYGMRVHPITGAYKLHTGVDVSAGIGTPFVAAANGIVSKATFNRAYGNMVIIDHGGGVQTLYAHGSEILVQVGDEVNAGDEVLKVGSTGYSTGPHAHFEIRINGQTVDPLDYLIYKKGIEEDEKTEENESEPNQNEQISEQTNKDEQNNS